MLIQKLLFFAIICLSNNILKQVSSATIKKSVEQSSDQKQIAIKVPPKCVNSPYKNLCDEMGNYPKDLKGLIEDQLSKFKETPSKPALNKTNHMQSDEIRTFCETDTIQRSIPHLSSSGIYKHHVQLEICRNAGAPCNRVEPPMGYNATCLQHYTEYKFLIMTPNGTYKEEYLDLQAGCICSFSAKLQHF